MEYYFINSFISAISIVIISIILWFIKQIVSEKNHL